MTEIDDPIASDLDRGSMYLEGEWEDVGDRDVIEDTNPATGEVVAEIPAGTEDDVDRAYEAAAAAHEEWAERPPQERAELIADAIDVIEERRDQLIELLGIEGGATQLKGNIELDIATRMMREAESFPFRAKGQHADSIVPGKENRVEREPAGVVGVISPWNFPLHLTMRAVAPALATGNGVVVKPASPTPITGGLLLGRVFDEAGIPPGLLNVVPGYGSDIGDPVVQHPEADVVAFTGSTEIGRGVAKNAAEHFAEPALELGGNNPHVVAADADLDQAVDAGVFGTFVHQGQVCISINRHVVHESLYDEYVSRLTERAESLPMGDVYDDDAVIGPIINEDQRDQMLDYVEETVEQGATLETGGDADGLFVEPTVLSDVENEMAAACNEHFGPIAPVIPFETDEEAVEIANATEYGLSGSVHSTDLNRAERIADAVDSGMIHINDQPINDEPHIPFGGVKDSGMGRYNGDQILQEVTELRWKSVQRQPREYPF